MVWKVVRPFIFIFIVACAEARRGGTTGWWEDTRSTSECHAAMQAVQSRIKEAMWELPLKGLEVEEPLASAPYKVKIHNIALHGNPAFEAKDCRYVHGDELEMDFEFHNIRIKGLVTLYDHHLKPFKDLGVTPPPKYYGFVASTIQQAPLALFMSRDYRYSSKMYVFRDAYVRLKDTEVDSFDAKEHRNLPDASLVDREIESLLLNAVRPILEREIRQVIWKEMKDAVIMPMKRYELSQGSHFAVKKVDGLKSFELITCAYNPSTYDKTGCPKIRVMCNFNKQQNVNVKPQSLYYALMLKNYSISSN